MAKIHWLFWINGSNIFVDCASWQKVRSVSAGMWVLRMSETNLVRWICRCVHVLCSGGKEGEFGSWVSEIVGICWVFCMGRWVHSWGNKKFGAHGVWWVELGIKNDKSKIKPCNQIIKIKSKNIKNNMIIIKISLRMKWQ